LGRPENSDNQFNFNGVKDGKSIPDDNGSKVDKKDSSKYKQIDDKIKNPCELRFISLIL
jgi:hypothetical protein